MEVSGILPGIGLQCMVEAFGAGVCGFCFIRPAQRRGLAIQGVSYPLDLKLLKPDTWEVSKLFFVVFAAVRLPRLRSGRCVVALLSPKT